MTVALVTGNKAHGHAERGNDLYETPTCATEALLTVEHLPHHIWEPACGRGAIADILRGRGHTVWATDLIDYGYPDSESRIDFLLERQTRIDVEAIVTNPPFKLANQFAAHAIEMCPKVIMLLRLGFLEGIRRAAILDGGKLARVHLFKKRLPMMHRDGWTGKKSTSAMAFGWFVWDRNHSGPTILHRINYELPVANDNNGGSNVGREQAAA